MNLDHRVNHNRVKLRMRNLMTSNLKIIDHYQQKLKINIMQSKPLNRQEKDQGRPGNSASISLLETLNFYRSVE